MSLKTKLIAFCLCIGLLPLAAMGVYSVDLAGRSLEGQARLQLVAARDARRTALGELAGVWEREARIFGANKGVYNALSFLRDMAYGADVAKTFDTTSDDYRSTADNVRAEFIPFVKVLGYDDAMLVDNYGWVLLSVKEGGELGHNVEGPLLKDSNLERAWKAAEKGKVTFVDFASYAPLGGAPAAFIAAPIYNHTHDSVEGVAVLRVPHEKMNDLMRQTAGMGESGETLLIGPDHLMRSDSTLEPARFSVAGSFAHPDESRIDNEAVAAALGGKSGDAIFVNHLGQKVLCAYTPVDFNGVTYALLAEVKTAEAFAAVGSLRLAALLLGLGTALVVILVSWMVVKRGLAEPLAAVSGYLQEVTGGNFSAVLKGDFKAEMADLARHIRAMVAELKHKLGFSDGILRNMTIPCFVTDLDNRLVFVNAPLLDLLECEGGPEAYLGKEAAAILSGTGLSSDLIENCLDSGKNVCNLEADIKGRKGTARHVRADAAPLHDLDGNPTGAFALVTDLTDIKSQEARIREQNALFARVAQEAESISQYVFRDSRQITDRVGLVTDGAKRQTERIHETSVAMEEMNANLSAVAQSAAEAARSAEDSREMALSGYTIMDGSREAMDRVREISARLETDMRSLDDRARGIGSIIEVISDIADQTNLLALNAAIEAARAGDAGRGFAVVADEVRKLAEKTMTATRQVSQSVQDIQKAAHTNLENTSLAARAVEEATSLVKSSGETLDRIVGLAESTAGRVGEIARAAEEQSAAHEQIHRSMEEVRRIADDTNSGMHDSRQSLDHLAVQAEELQRLIVTITE
ncbi:methyl-accepting chemotaxis sensory transducer [Desulfovibrio sp. X2]|uniref:methyl-accepting chemotaxis protein n=1 Tax=Desulfovibrio sp. X2 TaxID=941449 RepID=UPI0003587C7E|nr:methyl-accepting chemotaxis protein [Desulfovibrio sp. X2]EPR43860.1 methyl-accepting chemotaxis sensory transducer [Desulfovibrio sp. X2]